MTTSTEKRRKNRFLQWIKSAISAAIGVQSNENRANDFSEGSIIPYVITGLILTGLFIVSMGIIALVALKLLS